LKAYGARATVTAGGFVHREYVVVAGGRDGTHQATRLLAAWCHLSAALLVDHNATSLLTLPALPVLLDALLLKAIRPLAI